MLDDPLAYNAAAVDTVADIAGSVRALSLPSAALTPYFKDLMPRIGSDAVTTCYSSAHTVVPVNDPHGGRSLLDTLSALFCHPASAVNECHSPSKLQRVDAVRLLEVLWEHSAAPQLGPQIHFTCDGVCIDITEHPAGLELTDCASGEALMLYGCDLAGLIQEAAARVLGVSLPNNVPNHVVSEGCDGATAGNLPLELWEEIALHLRDYDDLAALMATSHQFGLNFGARTRMLQLRALWTFRQREIAPLTVVKSVLALVKPWPHRARAGVLYAVTRLCKVSSRDPKLFSLLAGAASDLPDWVRLRVFKELVDVAHVCDSGALWRRCATEIRGVRSVHPGDRASALVALAASFGKLDTASPPRKQEDFDELFCEATTLPPGYRRKMVAELANGAVQLDNSICREAAWTRCASMVYDLNQRYPSGSGEALFVLADGITFLEPKEAKGRACLALVAEFSRLDPADPYWTDILELIDSELPRAYYPAALATLTSALIRLGSDHPKKGWALQVVLAGIERARYLEINSGDEADALLSLVHAVSALTNGAPNRERAVLQVLSHIPALPVELRERVWEAIYRAVPETLDTAADRLQAELRLSLDLAIASLPDQQQAETLPREAKHPRHGEGGS